MGRPNEDLPQVVTAVAETLRHRREEGIPEAELVTVAAREGVWPYQIMEALDLSLQAGGIFRPKPPRKAQEEPERPPAESSPGRHPRGASVATLSWGGRLDVAVAEQWPDASWPDAEVVVPLARMEGLGWPASSWKHPSFWSASHEAGRTARVMGWEPMLRDGVGLVLRRKPSR